MALEKDIASIIEPELQSGHFSDAYVSCGSLESGSLMYSQSWSASNAYIFDLASLTKALVTGPLVFDFLNDVNISMDASLSSWGDLAHLPDAIRQRSAYQLLAHISGLPAWWNFWVTHLNEVSPQEMRSQERMHRIEEILARIPIAPIGKDIYSDVGYISLGYALEALHKKDIQDLWRSWKQKINYDLDTYPLDFLRGLASCSKSDFVPTAYCNLRKRLLQGEVHDENCAALGSLTGHAGLFGSGKALDAYLLSLYRSSRGHAYLTANFEKLQSTDREGLLGLRRGSVSSAVAFGKGRGMGHLGFTGTAFWIDWEKRIFGTFLTNRVCSGRIPIRIGEVRSLVFGKLYEAFDT